MRNACTILGLCVFIAMLLCARDAVAADYQAGTPDTYLFDTGSASAEPLSADALAAKTGWTLLEEDDTTHKFRGDAVLLNDKLAVVLRGRYTGVEVYSQAGGKWKERAVLSSRSATRLPNVSEASVTIAENTRAAAALEVTSNTATFIPFVTRYHLTAGQRILEVRPGEGTGRVVVAARTRYLVVPDFFADDMVFGPRAFAQRRLGLPAENLLLSLIEGGDAMLVCLWRSGRQGAEAFLGPGSHRTLIYRCEIECAKGASVWLAILEGTGLWSERPISAEQAGKEIVLEAKPPFPARWRTDYVRPDGVTRSQNFAGADRLIVYPLDRVKETPLTAFCPTDVLRDTLGIGPCQYILQTEGLATDTNPTPDQVMGFVEKQFERKKEKKGAEEIKDALKQMSEQVGQAQARIGKYAAFAREVRALCAGKHDKEAARAAETFARIAGEMAEAVAAGRGATDAVKQAASLAEQIVSLIGKDSPLPECRRLAAEARDLGIAQDRTLSKCRMAARWMKQQAATVAAANQDGAALAKQVAAAADNVLQNK